MNFRDITNAIILDHIVEIPKEPFNYEMIELKGNGLSKLSPFYCPLFDRSTMTSKKLT